MKNKAYLNCLPRDEAQSMWRKSLSERGYFDRLPVESLPVTAALGRVTASTVYAKQSVPHYNGSAMDGIAVYAPDTFGAQETAPKKLTLLPPSSPFTPGGCYVVDTGDAMPAGTNAVIMIEDVHIAGGMAEIIAAAAPWQHVRIIGEDIVTGELVIPEHHVIAPVDIAALLATGLERLDVVKKPKVAVIPTGDELVATREELQPGSILDVNSHMLAAAVTEWGGEPIRKPIVKDNREAIEQALLESLAESDMVIINAGTSAGREDYTAHVLGAIGEVLVHGIAIKPGKPVVLAICQGKPVIGLPGYPVSAMLTAELFVRDILLARQKLPSQEPPQVEVTLAKAVTSTLGMEEYIRVSIGDVQGKRIAAPLSRGAGMISSLTKAQGVIRVDGGSTGLPAGFSMPVTLLRKHKPARTILSVGSHDLALELLGLHLRRQLKNVALSCANVGSMGGIMAIRNKEAHIAGIHLLDEHSGRYNVPFVKKYLPDLKGCLVHLAMREQGLIVSPGNPKGIRELRDLVRPEVTYINRQRGSGTRMLLDYELGKAGITPAAIAGYDKEVGTHMAVAASVAAGTADAGLGVRAAAQALALDFVPIAHEQYDLLLNFAPDDDCLQAIIVSLRSEDFRREVEHLGGYDLRNAGKIISVDG
ncbi:molybdenum cofactor biosynthesis protein, putative [Heliomicrobium modesticaldum Ice1]|uniref:Molybdopterin molybdenumtransferase n=1 Tax=Heliobacterium modesticaldum (strain ATCC 51547 / Ice1) TaxID=498761 RepID=B0TBJ2_HELMI|nr:molybdopterin biosynthesis protein [Heliomicrobium modesticaldum]ABZ85205.1 molybdenum cofactor biosynthesis protein, putative [Heliomicrobium modesticaldum Ice1]